MGILSNLRDLIVEKLIDGTPLTPEEVQHLNSPDFAPAPLQPRLPPARESGRPRTMASSEYPPKWLCPCCKAPPNKPHTPFCPMQSPPSL